MSIGSAYEVEYHALLAKDLNILEPSAYNSLQEQIVEVKQMLAALHAKIKSDSGFVRVQGR